MYILIYTLDKALVSRIYKELLQLSESNAIFKISKNWQTLKIYEMSLIIKRCLASLSGKVKDIINRKVKSQGDTAVHIRRWLWLKLWGCMLFIHGQMHCWGGNQMTQPLCKVVWQFLIQVTIHLHMTQ